VEESKGPLRVCLTGFGDFGMSDSFCLPDYMSTNHIAYNSPIQATMRPSWLAVKQLRDLTLYTMHHSRPGLAGDGHQAVLAEVKRRPIQVNCLRIPVVYEDVLLIVPALHAQPPMPPPSHDKKEFPISTPPSQGYDLAFHIGAGMAEYRLRD
jgi:hypothetical protein